MLKLSSDGGSILNNTELGGSNHEGAQALLADAASNVVVAGWTSSADFPVSPGVVQARLASSQNLFVAKLDAAGKVIVSTYLGGSGADLPAVLRADAAGNIYVAGRAPRRTSRRLPASSSPPRSCPSGVTVRRSDLSPGSARTSSPSIIPVT